MDHYYETRDVYLASTLLTLDYHLVKIEKKSTVYYFYFLIEERQVLNQMLTTDEAADSYWRQAITVNASKLFQSLKSLKVMMKNYGRLD